MNLENLALASKETYNLPIRHEGDIHKGKVRAVYWITKEDSKRLIKDDGYAVHPEAQLGIMITSDNISAFDVIWHSQYGLSGIQGKGADLNATAYNILQRLKNAKIGDNHIVGIPHPLVWLVQKAEPVMIEGIERGYITGSMWRDYEKGKRTFGGNIIRDRLHKNEKLDKSIYTPTTKGILRGIPGVPEKEDTKLDPQQIRQNYRAFGYKSLGDVDVFENMVEDGFVYISKDLDVLNKILVDAKFELGYIIDENDKIKLIFIDEAVTPDAARCWDKDAYKKGKIIEESKEGFRQFLLANCDKNILLDDDKMEERRALAAAYDIPVEVFFDTAETYHKIREEITGTKPPVIENPREEIVEILDSMGLIVK